MKHWTSLLAAAGFIAAAAFVPANAADISGAGATFPYPIYAKWADAYKKETGNGLNYQSIGSGGGIKQIKAKTVTFGAVRRAAAGQGARRRSASSQFPMVMGGIVPVVNLDGIKAGELTIDGPTLAKIFLGEIKKWNDPAIEKLNPSAKLPDQAIAVVHRSDGSGTTFIFTYYLSKVSADWKSKVGINTSVAVAGRHRRQGQRRRRQQRRQHQGLDRLRRVRLRQAEQADLHQDGQQGRQDGRRRPRRRSRRRRPMPTGNRSPASA